MSNQRHVLRQIPWDNLTHLLHLRAIAAPPDEPVAADFKRPSLGLCIVVDVVEGAAGAAPAAGAAAAHRLGLCLVFGGRGVAEWGSVRQDRTFATPLGSCRDFKREVERGT